MSTITFRDFKKTIQNQPHQTILELAFASSIDLDYGCGATQCGICIVQITGNCILSEVSPREKTVIDKSISSDTSIPNTSVIRLACTVKILSGDAIVFSNTLSK